MAEQKDQREEADREQKEQRSPRYPAFRLNEMIPLVRKLWDKERRTVVPPDVAVKAWGYSGLHGVARTKLATMKQYGLLDEDRQGVKLSELALTLLQHDEGSREYKAAVEQAALTPELFKQLASSMPEASNDAIKRDLVFRRGFLESAADQAIKAYRDTLAFVTSVTSTYLVPEVGEEEELQEVPFKRLAANPAGTEKRPFSLRDIGIEPVQRTYVWPLPNGVIAEVKFTGPAGPAHFDFLQQYLELAKKAVAVEQSDSGAAGNSDDGSR